MVWRKNERGEGGPGRPARACAGFPEGVGAEKGTAFLVIVDEFQGLLERGAPSLHLFRRIAQDQARVACMLAGSPPSTMWGIVDDARSPLCRRLHEVGVGPLPDGVMRPFPPRRLRQAGGHRPRRGGGKSGMPPEPRNAGLPAEARHAFLHRLHSARRGRHYGRRRRGIVLGHARLPRFDIRGAVLLVERP